MKITRGEYCQFGLRSRLKLLQQFGAMVCERQLKNVKVQIFKLYDFFVEVFVDVHTKAILKAEPVISTALIDFYKYLLPVRHPQHDI
jgi:hypothetical protein